MIFTETNSLGKEVSYYLNTQLPHYRITPPRNVTKTYTYTLSSGEDIYSVAKKIFSNVSNWTIIADLNKWKMPDQFVEGDTIIIPEIVAQ